MIEVVCCPYVFMLYYCPGERFALKYLCHRACTIDILCVSARVYETLSHVECNVPFLRFRALILVQVKKKVDFVQVFTTHEQFFPSLWCLFKEELNKFSPIFSDKIDYLTISHCLSIIPIIN